MREMYGLTRGLRNLRILVLSGAVSTLGSGLLNPILPVYLQSRGLDLESIGLVFTLGALLPIVLQPVLGALSDRFSRKGFVVGLSLGTSLLVPAFAVLSHPLALALALAMKLMLSQSAAPISSAMVADFAPSNQRATVFALLDGAVNLMFVVALVASAGVVEWLGIRGVFYVAGGLFIAGSLILFGLQETSAGAPQDEGSRTGWGVAARALLALPGELRRSPAFAALFAYQFCFAFALDLYPVYLPLYVVKLGASQALVGPLTAASWLLYAIVQPTGGRLSDRKAGRKGLITAGLAGMVVCSLLLGLAGWAPHPFALVLMVGAWVLLAIPDGLFRPAAMALVVECIPAEERGRILGSLGAASALAGVVAPLAYGLIASHAGLGAAFILSSGALALALGSIVVIDEPIPTSITTPSPDIR